jgi:hypothetical protein
MITIELLSEVAKRLILSYIVPPGGVQTKFHSVRDVLSRVSANTNSFQAR